MNELRSMNNWNGIAAMAGHCWNGGALPLTNKCVC